MPICLVILSGAQDKEIYELSELYYLKITVELYKKTGPSQCHSCQKFGHGSSNSGNAPQCVKCAGSHNTGDCSKTHDHPPTCANYNGPHTANYHGYPLFTQAAGNLVKNQLTLKESSTTQNTFPPTVLSIKTLPPSHPSTGSHLNYATASKSKPAI